MRKLRKIGYAHRRCLRATLRAIRRSKRQKDRTVAARETKARQPDTSAAAHVGAAPSLSVAVHDRMRADILAGRFDPGSRLSPRELATEFEVSLSVVREALSRLAEQGLVVATPQLGFSVVSLDVDDLVDLTKVRVLIEGAALRQAVEHTDIEYETRVVAAHHRLTRTPFLADEASKTITDEWAAAHAAFHDALISASPSFRLRDLSANLRDHSELYRRWSGPFAAGNKRRDVEGEHRSMMQAVLDHDADRAVHLLADHINLTTSILISFATSCGVANSEASA
jgi:DNA-binding GntR family transcriptional regulator